MLQLLVFRQALLYPLLVTLLGIFGIQRASAQDANRDSCFINYLRTISPEVVFFKRQIQQGEFVFFASERVTLYKRVIYFDLSDRYIVAISQNLFSEGDVDDFSAAQILVYSREKNEMALFLHRNRASTSCRNSIGIFDILPASDECYIFNSQCKISGEFLFRFDLLDAKPIFKAVKSINGEQVYSSFPLEKVKMFTHRLDLLFDASHFTFLLDQIFNANEKIPDNGKWLEYGNGNHFVKFIESRVAVSMPNECR